MQKVLHGKPGIFDDGAQKGELHRDTGMKGNHSTASSLRMKEDQVTPFLPILHKPGTL
jgi:hypothetical protein